MEIRVRVQYVDGAYFDVPCSEWESLPGEGIDYIEIGTSRFTRTSGHSVYWIYKEDKNWIMGSGPVGYGKLSPEVVVEADGTQTARTIEFMPDLHLKNVKLGWWWPDEERRPING